MYNAFMQSPINFFAGTDLVVVGTNSEIADICNPRGEVIRSASFVYAEDIKGYRVRLYVETDWETKAIAAAENLAACLNARLALGKLPVGFAHWHEARPCYGSTAYIDLGIGEQEAFQDRFDY